MRLANRTHSRNCFIRRWRVAREIWVDRRPVVAAGAAANDHRASLDTAAHDRRLSATNDEWLALIAVFGDPCHRRLSVRPSVRSADDCVLYDQLPMPYAWHSTVVLIFARPVYSLWRHSVLVTWSNSCQSVVLLIEISFIRRMQTCRRGWVRLYEPPHDWIRCVKRLTLLLGKLYCQNRLSWQLKVMSNL